MAKFDFFHSSPYEALIQTYQKFKKLGQGKSALYVDGQKNYYWIQHGGQGSPTAIQLPTIQIDLMDKLAELGFVDISSQSINIVHPVSGKHLVGKRATISQAALYSRNTSEDGKPIKAPYRLKRHCTGRITMLKAHRNNWLYIALTLDI